jgi:hypothetical protein
MGLTMTAYLGSPKLLGLGVSCRVPPALLDLLPVRGPLDAPVLGCLDFSSIKSPCPAWASTCFLSHVAYGLRGGRLVPRVSDHTTTSAVDNGW